MELIFKRCYSLRKTRLLKIASSNYPNKAYRSSICPSALMKLNPIHLNPDAKIRFQALTHLYIIRQQLDGRLIKIITMFPATLKVLNLSGTAVTHIKEESFWFKVMFSLTNS